MATPVIPHHIRLFVPYSLTIFPAQARTPPLPHHIRLFVSYSLTIFPARAGVSPLTQRGIFFTECLVSPHMTGTAACSNNHL